MSDFIRYTERNKFGNADIIGVDSGELFKNLSNVQGVQLCDALNYFAELEDKIENGMLVELPCKVGDTVYRVYEKCNGSSCPYNGNYGQWRCHYKGKERCEAFIDEKKFSYEMLNDLEKSIFVVKGEAEAKLKKIQENKK